jgi:hypothetical protein
MEVRVIAMEGRGSHLHPKYTKREAHVHGTLLPSLSALGMPVCPFPAITNEQFAREPGPGRGFASYGTWRLPCGDGCIGNFLSHLELWKLAIELGGLLVLEDDALLPPEHAPVVKAAIGDYLAIPDSADILYLQSTSPCHENSLKAYTGLVHHTTHLVRLPQVGDLSGTAAYAIRPEAAKRLLAAVRETTATDAYLHRAAMSGIIGVVLPGDYKRGFLLPPGHWQGGF